MPDRNWQPLFLTKLRKMKLCGLVLSLINSKVISAMDSEQHADTAEMNPRCWHVRQALPFFFLYTYRDIHFPFKHMKSEEPNI